MIKLTLTFIQPHHKMRVIESILQQDDLTLAHLKKLWEAEQTLNNIPGCDIRLHLGLEDMGNAKSK